MKKVLLLCLLAYFSTAVAQTKSDISITDLIKSKSFTFIVSDIKKKPGFNGVYGYGNAPNFNRLNPSTMTIEQSKNVTLMAPGSTGSIAQIDYYRLSQLDGSYFTAYNIQTTPKSDKNNNDSEEIYLTQKNDGLIISELKNPNSVSELKKSGFYTLTANNYKVKSSKKSDGSWLLTYTLKGGDQKQTFYLEISADGSAVLMQEPTKEFTTNMFGKIQPIIKKSI